jgi:hypothetical protein
VPHESNVGADFTEISADHKLPSAQRRHKLPTTPHELIWIMAKINSCLAAFYAATIAKP